MTPLKFSRWRPLTSRIYFRFKFGSAHVLRRSGSLSVSNFLKIFPATAELLLLPVWKTKGGHIEIIFPVSISTCQSSACQLILHQHTKFHVNRTIVGVVMTSLKVSRRQPLTLRISFQFQFHSDDVVRRSGTLCIPNFVTMSQSLAGL